jgi:hypothetical protein
MHREPRWPDGGLISVIVATDVVALIHCKTLDGEAASESFGALSGRIDATGLAVRLKELRPRCAMLTIAGDPGADPFESGMALGTVAALVAALGIEVEHAAVETWAPDRAQLH